MDEIKTVLLVPATVDGVFDPHGLLREGPGAGRPPAANYCAHERRLSTLSISGKMGTTRSLLLLHSGDPVPEGMDRAERVMAKIEKVSDIAPSYTTSGVFMAARVYQNSGLGTALFFNAEGCEVDDE